MPTITMEQLKSLQQQWQKQQQEATDSVSYYRGAVDAASILISHLEAPAVKEEEADEQCPDVSEEEAETDTTAVPSSD